MEKHTPFPIYQNASRFHDKTTIYNFDTEDKSSLGLRKVGGIEREHMAYGTGIIHGTGLPFSVQERLKETTVMKDIKKVKERR